MSVTRFREPTTTGEIVKAVHEFLSVRFVLDCSVKFCAISGHDSKRLLLIRYRSPWICASFAPSPWPKSLRHLATFISFQLLTCRCFGENRYPPQILPVPICDRPQSSSERHRSPNDQDQASRQPERDLFGLPGKTEPPMLREYGAAAQTGLRPMPSRESPVTKFQFSRP